MWTASLYPAANSKKKNQTDGDMYLQPLELSTILVKYITYLLGKKDNMPLAIIHDMCFLVLPGQVGYFTQNYDTQ